MQTYAGIGSRETPVEILDAMRAIAYAIAQQGAMLRSGGAKGADTAFETGCRDAGGDYETFLAGDCTYEAMELSSEYHPNWGACREFARKLHGRNAMIILGESLNDPVELVICWTPDGKASGGTGQAIRIAEAYDIPIFNLYDQENLEFIRTLIGDAPSEYS